MSWTREAQADCCGIAKLARQLQPGILLRNRGIGNYGDYETPERQIPEDPSRVNRPWQVIYPGGKNFSYNQNDTYKTREWILATLIDTVAKGGNFQVGFGPDPTGAWPTQMIERVSYVGDWLKVNGEAIYATRPYLRYHDGKDLRFTRSKDKKILYIISLKWPGAVLESTLARPKTGSTIRLIGYDHDLKWQQDADKLTIQMPDELNNETKRPCQQAYVFKVESQAWDKLAEALPAEPSK
jgi:alpha-L-fucosidase